MTAVADRRPADSVAPDAASSARGTPVGVHFLGHATVLLDLPGLRILTDPFFRDRLGLLRRHGDTPQPGAIGPIEIVIVSHAHPDHFDRSSLRAVRGDPLVIVPRGLGGSVRRSGLRAREVTVGERVGLAPGWSVTAVPARHWRWLSAPRAPTVGYLIEGPGRVGIYFAGDTSRFDGLLELAGRVDLALLPVGSWGPHLTPGHLSPRSAAELARTIGARSAIPIHWGTLYPRGLHRILGGRLTRPATRFAEWSGRLAPELEVHLLQPGEAKTLEL